MYGDFLRADLRRFPIVIVLGCVALVGCQGANPPTFVEVARPSVILPELSDTCGSADFAGYIGQNFTELSTAPVSVDMRVIRPGKKVNGFISPSRLNVQIDANGVVRRLYCG
jgi:hypothetical protein